MRQETEVVTTVLAPVFLMRSSFFDKGVLCGQETTTPHLMRISLMIVMRQEKIVKLTI